MFETESINKTPDSNIKYTGNNYPELGIQSGMPMKEVNDKLIGMLDSYEGSGKVKTRVNELFNNINSIDASRLAYNKNTYGLASNVSKQGSQLLGRKGDFEVTTGVNNTTLQYSVLNAVESLPQGFVVREIRHVIKGSVKNGNSIVSESNDKFRTINVDPERYPLNIVSNIRIGTGDGEISLIGRKRIANPIEDEGSYNLKVEDYTEADNFQLKLDEFLEIIAAKVSELDSKTSSLYEIEKKLSQVESNYVEFENKLNQLESSGNIVVEDGQVVNPTEKYNSITERLSALLKKK